MSIPPPSMKPSVTIGIGYSSKSSSEVSPSVQNLESVKDQINSNKEETFNLLKYVNGDDAASEDHQSLMECLENEGLDKQTVEKLIESVLSSDANLQKEDRSEAECSNTQMEEADENELSFYDMYWEE